MVNTPWISFGDKKLYVQSGQFSVTVKTSLDISGTDASPYGISWDGTNTPWVGVQYAKFYLQSGQFSSTVKTSLDPTGIDSAPRGISWDGADTPWCGGESDKLYLQSGQFSSTVKTSRSIVGIDTNPLSISYDGTNTPWIGSDENRLYVQSGKFSVTLKTSLTVSVKPYGITWDGTNTPWCAYGKLYLQSGQFSSTIKASLSASGSIDISTDDVNARLGTGSDGYTRGNYASLPTDDANLETEYTSGDNDDVATNNAVRVAQAADGEYAIHQFKDNVGNPGSINFLCNLQSDLASSTSDVVLQIYNYDTTAWETLDTESGEGAGSDFDLTGNVPDMTDYLSSEWCCCRVYQLGVD